MNDEKFNRYITASQSAMLQYQLIEVALKMYIKNMHFLIKSKLPPELNFDYKESEFDSMPLERLLNVFSKYSKNEDLIRQLNKLREQRNYVAHKAFSYAFLNSFNYSENSDFELEKIISMRDASIQGFMAIKRELEWIAKFRD